jgi:hypothetical protein
MAAIVGTRRHSARDRLLGPLKALLRGPELRENADRFRVKGKHDETNKVELIDLLRDQLIVRKQVLRLGARSRAVDASSAFAAIKAAHVEVGDDLRRAAGVVS